MLDKEKRKVGNRKDFKLALEVCHHSGDSERARNIHYVLVARGTADSYEYGKDPDAH